MMSCTVAISNSPIFSPSRLSSPEPPLTRIQSPPSTAAPSSPLRILRLQKPPPSVFNRASSSSDSVSPTVLKRKRPARLDIPIVSLGFGNIPATPAAAAMEEVVEFEGDEFSVCCKRGRRGLPMEDRYSAKVNFHHDSKQAVFGVFDGHGGAKAAEFAAQNLGMNILNEVEKRGDDETVEAVKCGYLKTDSKFLEQDLRGGSCCVTALVKNGNLVVSNAGDCRAVVSRGGVAEALTSDHRPSRNDEKDRIEALGGYVDYCNGVWRIQGSLAVSRSIGDRYLKQWVISEPETQMLALNPEHEFLILASDGLWDKVNNQEAVDLVRSFCSDQPQLLLACRKLIDLSVSRGSYDDVSVMIIQLQRFL